MKFISGGQRRRIQPRCARRSLRANRELLQTPRVLHLSSADRRDDGHHSKDHGRGAEHLRDRNERNETGPSEYITLSDT
jgi:hypothetical protein